MNQDITISKEGAGDVFELLQESSDESSIDVQREIKKPVRKIGNSTAKTGSGRGRLAPKPYQPPPPPPQHRPRPQAEPQLPDTMFEVFTNPDKTRVESDPEDEPVYHQHQEDHPPDEYMDEPDEYEQGPPMFQQDDSDMPSPGFQTVEDEKQDLLYKFYRMQSKGVPVSRKFNIHSDIRDMRNEYERIKRDSEVNASIRFSRRMLMACVTGIEFLNKRYDPFDIHLEGWSESVIENVTDYDNVFERLHDKYASKVAMAPEIELLLSLAGSAFMFHLTNSMFSNAMPNIRDIAQQNPEIIKNMMQSMQMAAASNKPAAAPTPDPPSETGATNGGGGSGIREMRPPAIDIHSLMSSTPFMPVGNKQFNEPTRTTDIVAPPAPSAIRQSNTARNVMSTFSPPPSIHMSDDDDESESAGHGGFRGNTRTISLNSETQISKGGTKRKRGKKISMNADNSITI